MVRALFEQPVQFGTSETFKCGYRMADDDPDAKRLAELEERLQKARRRGEEIPKTTDRSASSIGIAFRLTFEIIAAVIVGAAIGWLLDRWLGTAPLLFIVFFFLGAGAGFVNVVRAGRQIEKEESDRSDKS